MLQLIYDTCVIVGYYASAPLATFYTYKIISYGMKAASVRAGIRPLNDDETCCGTVDQFCGNNTACVILVYLLWKKGKDVYIFLLMVLVIQSGVFIWYAVEMSTLVDSVIPSNYAPLERMFVANLYYIGGSLLSVLTILSCTLYWVIQMNKETYLTSVIAAGGAGGSLAILSDFTSILLNALAAGIPGIAYILICTIASVWSLGLMLAFVAVVESRPFPLTMPLVQPMVFGIVSFCFAVFFYGSFDDCKISDLRSAPCLFLISLFCIVIDSKKPSCEQKSGAPQAFILVAPIWDQILYVTKTILTQPIANQDANMTFSDAEMEQVARYDAEINEMSFDKRGGLLASPSDLDMISPSEMGSGEEESEEIEMVFRK